MEILNKDGRLFQTVSFEEPKTLHKGNSGRADILFQIKQELDKSVGSTFKDKNGKIRKVQAVSISYLAFKLSHIKGDSALWAYHKECLNATVPYSRALWGNIKIRKEKPSFSVVK